MDTFCSNCGEPFFGGLCVWCTCDQCGDNIRDGVCLNCNSHTYDQRSFNNPSNIPDYYTPPPLSFNCYICGNPSEEGMSCGRCFCNECGYINCMCYAPSANTSYACDTSFDNFPQNDFNPLYQNSYEQVPFFHDNSFQNTSNFEHCGGSSENFYEPNSSYDSYGFNQPPQTSDFTNQNFEIKSMIEKLKEMVTNRITSTPEPNVKSMEELLAEERKFQFCECCMYDDDSTITINLNPQNESIFSTVEPEDSLTMGDGHLDTIPATKSDEFNKSSVENLVRIPSESEEISNNDSEFVENNRFDDHTDTNDIPFDDNRDEIFSDSDEDDSISCGDIDDNDEDDNDLVPRVSKIFNMTFTNPLFEFESDFNLISNNPIFDIPSDESEMEPEVQDSHHMIDSFHEKFSDEFSHIISKPENDPFLF
jgi:hypothetical protein